MEKIMNAEPLWALSFGHRSGCLDIEVRAPDRREAERRGFALLAVLVRAPTAWGLNDLKQIG
jgi:hypothetical protein